MYFQLHSRIPLPDEMRRQVTEKQKPDALLLSYRASTARDSHPGTLGS